MKMEDCLASFTRRIGPLRGTHYLYDPLRRFFLERYRRPGSNPWTIISDFDRDLKMALDRSAHIGSTIYWRGFYSIGIIRFLGKVLRANSVFFDVGANQGEISLYAAKRLRSGTVVAFEPASKPFEQLTQIQVEPWDSDPGGAAEIHGDLQIPGAHVPHVKFSRN